MYPQHQASHRHGGLTLSLADDGTQGIRYRGEPHLGGRGVLFARPPCEVHAGEPLEKNSVSRPSYRRSLLFNLLR
ncbi:AraC family ligand binding domain-containing protein [Parasedimentitalea huanghaiensis]|uniref:AraC family ligand binding domain-containing protein n=1 Tax=Parasedimentitalea huanghaiensis TaxID=2682100 RepID=UPI003CC91629